MFKFLSFNSISFNRQSVIFARLFMIQTKTLYISYDGMTDPLGQSQVIPYLSGLAQNGYDITLLSTEKKDKLIQNGDMIAKLLKEKGIKWEHILFTKNPPLLSKFYDLEKLKAKALKLHKQNNYKLVHCRSYVAAEAGLRLKQRFNIKFLFDMRGFWVDERVDGGLWNLNNPAYKRLYNWYKKKEAAFISNADAIVSLTHAGKKEMLNWKSYSGQQIDVIPCSADFDLFSLTNDDQKNAAREKTGIAKDALVVSYLGSIGTWYMIDEMLRFFKLLKQKNDNAKFLFISNGEHELIKLKALQIGINHNDLVLTSGSRKEVPFLSKAADVSLSFIKPCYSKISSSPTKLGELLAMGIPVICNSGVGDVKQIVESTHGGLMFDNFDDASFENIIQQLSKVINLSPEEIRNNAFQIYDLHKSQKQYLSIYKRLLP